MSPPLLVPILCLLSVLSNPAVAAEPAESLVTIADPLYATRPVPPQALPVNAAIHQVVYPVLGMPALVRPGEVFTIRLATSCAMDEPNVQAWLDLVGLSSVGVSLVVEGLTPMEEAEAMWALQVRVPRDVAADHYHLRVADGGCLADRQPSAVRVHREGDAYRFAVLADQQAGDPRARTPGGAANGTLHPAWVDNDVAATQERQVQNELEFLDPLFVLYPGDLVFGLDYGREYPALQGAWSETRLAAFMVPGNHDGYAHFAMEPRGGWASHAGQLAWCGRHLQPPNPLSSVMNVGACVVERLAGELDYTLLYDGQEGFRRTLGPQDYVFQVGQTRFIGLDSYGGSVARRMSVPISLKKLQAGLRLETDPLVPDLGAALVDNYGGWLSLASQDWALGQVAAARDAGLGVVIFAHHDPTGVFMGAPAVYADMPFGTDPTSRAGFEVWNYDSAAWDSDPSDDQPPETATIHSGTRLLGKMPAWPLTWFSGHAHRDAQRGTARPDVRIVQTTTAGSALAGLDAYRGYRLVEMSGGTVQQVDWDAGRGMGSVPSGHLWVEDAPGTDGLAKVVVNGLPQPMSGRLRFVLPFATEGYRFTTGRGQPLPLSDLVWSPQGMVAYVQVEAPAANSADFARQPLELGRLGVRAERAVDNQAPAVEISVAGQRSNARKPLKLRARREGVLVVAADEPLWRVLWSIDGQEQSGSETVWLLRERGTTALQVVAYDEYGARTEIEQVLRVRRCWFCR